MSPIRLRHEEVLNRICGGLEVAGDIVQRSEELYRASGRSPDRGVLELMTLASASLERAVESIHEQLREPPSGRPLRSSVGAEVAGTDG